MTQISNPFQYVADPTQSRAVFNGRLFFGVPDTDPTLAQNQKLVRGVQENGNIVSLPQPVSTGSGGVPEFEGSPVILDIDGDYSFTVWNRFDSQVYYAPRVENPEDGSAGFSGIVVIEDTVLTPSQTTIVLTTVGANESVFYLQTALGDQGFLKKDTDYTVTNSTTIELTQSFNTGDIIVARQNDPTGQLIPVVADAEALLVFVDLATAAASAVAGDLVIGNTVTLNGNAVEGDGLGGDKYKVIVTAFANDGVNYLDLNGTLQLELQNNYYRFQNYAERIAVASIAAGILSINLDLGVVQTITLTESVTDIVIANFNPDVNYSSTLTLRVTQDGVGGHGIAWPVSFLWPNGAAPTVSAGIGDVDEFVFTTFDAGVTWSAKTTGQQIA